MSTERKDHDSITYAAIDRSDLLVFTITSNLFDDLILQNFIRLAYEQGYRNKMILIVNKMSQESGDFTTLTKNYTETLTHSLGAYGYAITDFRVSFIDAADYLDKEPDLLESSHFSAFVAELNAFVQTRGVLGRLDTPIRAVVAQLDRALLAGQTDEQSRRFFQLLDRIEHRVRRADHEAQIELRHITSGLRTKIITRTHTLVVGIGDEQAVQTESDAVEQYIQQEVKQAQCKLEQYLNGVQQKLAADVREVLASDLGQYYLGVIAAGVPDLDDPQVSDNTPLRRNYDTLSQVLKNISGEYLRRAGVTGTTGTITSIQVAGTPAHTLIYDIGKFFGHNFQPWGAVKLAKNIANVAKVVGPILIVVGVLIDAYDLYSDEQNKRKVIAARNQCARQFCELADGVQRQFETQFQAYQAEFSGEILKLIERRRDEAICAIQERTALDEEIIAWREQLKALLDAIYT